MSYDAWLEPPENYAKEAPVGNCEKCEGTGKIDNEDFDPDLNCSLECKCEDNPRIVECYKCEGTGEIEIETCDSCNCAPCQCDAQYDAWRDR